MDILEKTEHNPKQLPITEKAVAFLEETCHISTEATTAIWPLTSEEDFRCAAKSVITLNTKRHSHLQTTSASRQDKRVFWNFLIAVTVSPLHPVIQIAECPLVRRLRI